MGDATGALAGSQRSYDTHTHTHRFTPRERPRKLSLTRRRRSAPWGAKILPLVAKVALIHRRGGGSRRGEHAGWVWWRTGGARRPFNQAFK